MNRPPSYSRVVDEIIDSPLVSDVLSSSVEETDRLILALVDQAGYSLSEMKDVAKALGITPLSPCASHLPVDDAVEPGYDEPHEDFPDGP